MSRDASHRRATARADNFRTLFDGTAGGVDYRGIPIFAAPGVHEAALALLEKHLPAATTAGTVLELGAGSGAMSLRLHDAGYRVVASDLFPERFIPIKEMPFSVLDLNGEFSTRVPDDIEAIVALELIEHLENPHHFLRQCMQALPPGGLLLLSTPNLGNPLSQAMSITSGFPQWFSREDWHAQGHIAPISPAILALAWESCGFDCVEQASVADPWRLLKRRKKLRLWLAAGLASWLSAVPKALRGEVYLAVLQKPAQPGTRQAAAR